MTGGTAEPLDNYAPKIAGLLDRLAPSRGLDPNRLLLVAPSGRRWRIHGENPEVVIAMFVGLGWEVEELEHAADPADTDSDGVSL